MNTDEHHSDITPSAYDTGVRDSWFGDSGDETSGESIDDT